MKCERCGAQIPEGAVACAECGAPVPAAGSGTAVQVAEAATVVRGEVMPPGQGVSAQTGGRRGGMRCPWVALGCGLLVFLVMCLCLAALVSGLASTPAGF